MTLPDDYARCHGAYRLEIGIGKNTSLSGCQWREPCINCLRRTAPMRDNKLYSYISPPDFTTTCPERIKP